MEWIYENNENEGCGVDSDERLIRPRDDDAISLLYTQHAIKYDISSERDLLMNTKIPDRDKLKFLVEKCNESIREKDKIWFMIGRSQRLDWHNEIPNPYL